MLDKFACKIGEDRMSMSGLLENIVQRFVTGAMSYGSISREAHEAMAIAMLLANFCHAYGKVLPTR